MEEAACPSTSFCGQMSLGNGSLGPCGACPWGWRARAGRCEPCDAALSSREWLYLGFSALLPPLASALALEWSRDRRRRRRAHVFHHVCLLLEAALAALLSLLALSPSLRIRTCSSAGLRDWYTLFANPSVGTTTLRCTQEAVYPLYSLPLIYHAFWLLCLCVMRPVLLRLCPKDGLSRPAYASLHVLPVLSLAQAVGGGLVFPAWPYLLLCATLVSDAVSHARCPQQQLWPLAKGLVTQPRRALAFGAHTAAYALGLGGLTDGLPPRLLPLLLLLPLPSAFYVLTAKLSHPKAPPL